MHHFYALVGARKVTLESNYLVISHNIEDILHNLEESARLSTNEFQDQKQAWTQSHSSKIFKVFEQF